MKKVIALFALMSALFAFAGEMPKEVNLWQDGKTPWQGSPAKFTAEQLAKNDFKKLVFYVEEPTYRLYLPSGVKDSGMVIISPGGSYSCLSYAMEGTVPAEWLAENGVAAMVLKYRVPNRPVEALHDIRRAIRIARANATQWGINPNKIAVMGFSAGGNLAARACASQESDYAPVDELDKLSAKPNLAVLMYPAYCDVPWFDKRWHKKNHPENEPYSEKYALAPNLKIDKATPPAFIFQNMGDTYGGAAFAYYLALRQAGVLSDLHIDGVNGHAGGIKKPIKKYLILDFLKNRGFIGKKK